MSPSYRILGIDPGVALLGYGVIEGENGNTTCVTYGCLTTPKNMALAERLSSLMNDLRKLLDEYKPDVVAVETIRFAQNQTTGIAVAEARGLILAIAAAAGKEIIELSPNEVKQALTSYGHAEKSQVQFMVKQVLKLNETPKPDDAADALAIALAAEPRFKQQFFIQRAIGS